MTQKERYNINKNIKKINIKAIDIDLDYLLYFNFLKKDEYFKIKKIILKNFKFVNETGTFYDLNFVKLFKKIYLKLKK